MAKMDLVSKLKTKAVVERIREMGERYGTKSPYVVELDPTTACDLACPGCISGELLNQKNTYDNRFQNDRLLELGDDLIKSGVKAVILIGGGEPLSHPRIGQLMEKLGQNDVQIGITTNGTFIEKYLAIIAEYSNWTRVSVDAGTDETFNYLRPTRGGKSKFFQVIGGMEKLAKVKKGILGYSYLIRTVADGMAPAKNVLNKFGTILQSNIGEIYEAARLAKEIGCDYLEVKPSYDADHNLVTHSEADMALTREMIAKAKTLEDDNFAILESVSLEACLKLEKMGDQPKEYETCPAADLRTLVTPTGVYVCPYFRGQEAMKIGDLRTQSITEMWQGDLRKKVLSELNPKKHCATLHCIRHKTNLEVLDIKKNAFTPEDMGLMAQSEKEDRFI